MTTVLIWWVAGVPLAVCLIAHLRAWLLGLSSRRAAAPMRQPPDPTTAVAQVEGLGQAPSLPAPAIAPAVVTARYCVARWRGGAPAAAPRVRRGDCAATARRSPAA